MRWFVVGGIVAGAIAAFLKSRDPEVADAMRVQVDQAKSSAVDAVDAVQRMKGRLVEGTQALFDEAVEEGKRASDRRMADLIQRFDELRQGQARRQLDAQA